MHFRREELDTFHATEFEFDPASGTILLGYRFSGPSVAGPSFEERIELGRPILLDPGQEVAFERVLRLLHAAAGTSYYKAAAPRVVAIESGPLTDLEVRFVRDLYDKGLREFAYGNSLQVPRDVEIRVAVETRGAPDDGAPPRGIAVPIGGGKDSVVLLEALRDLNPILVSVNAPRAALKIARESGLELASITRTLDPSLLELNASGALNGHVPITAVVSLIAVVAGYAFGYSTTVMALEGSANEPTRIVDGTPVNHQWSKSAECETELSSALSEISPEIGYVSPLRDLSEIEIARAFATLPRYFSEIRSCNKNFSMTNDFDGWCMDCPKCRFVYLMLATVVDRETLVRMFGADMLGQTEQISGFIDLLDIDRKPFECVGTRDESIAAFSDLAGSARWRDSVVVRAAMPYLSDSLNIETRSPEGVFDEIRIAVGGVRLLGSSDTPT